MDIAFNPSCILILMLILPELVQDKAMAIYCICGIIRVPCWSSGHAGTRCTHGQGSLFMDWCCWHPSVRLCVDQVLSNSFSLDYFKYVVWLRSAITCSGLMYWTVHSEEWAGTLYCLKMLIFMVKQPLYTLVCHGKMLFLTVYFARRYRFRWFMCMVWLWL